MRITNTVATAASIAVLSTSAFAGGMSEPVMDEPIVMEEPMVEEPAGSGVAGLVVLGVLAAALIYVATQD
ncbi:MAG: hypothetical protein ACSHW1_01440 [Yoonia sp.]|uniref:hypothetical protein n=1 Tax=Yoonia sp. TaxID=2212373 RepID=UPI003EF5814F